MTSAQVTSAVEVLYRVFSEPPGQPLVGCPCCVDPADSESLRRGRREDVPADVLGHYAFKAMTTWGDERDFRWFLPRIAEVIAAEGSVGAVDIALFASKCVSAGWPAWSADQRLALTAFVDALWRAAVDDTREDADAPDDLLEAGATLDVDLTMWIAYAMERDAMRFLAEMVISSILSSTPRSLRLRSLVALASTHERLVAAYLVTPDERVAYAADLLASLGDLPP